MKIILTQKTDIVGKDKREWVKLSYLRQSDASIGEIIIPKATYEEFGLENSDYVAAEVYEEFVKNSPVVDADFDARGRIITIVK